MFCDICKVNPRPKTSAICTRCEREVLRAARSLADKLRVPTTGVKGIPKAAGTPRKRLGTTWEYPRVRRTRNFCDSVFYEFRQVRKGYGLVAKVGKKN